MSIEAVVEQSSKSTNRRGSARWHIHLAIPSGLDSGQAKVVVHDISTAGMLIETDATLKTGQSVRISLPEADPVIARVVWQDEPLFGCRFDQALPQGVVSALRLRNPGGDDANSVGVPPAAKTGEGLPERMRRLRQEQGLTRAELSERTGFSKPTIWGWESGKSAPRKENLCVLAELFGLTEQQLLFGDESSSSSAKNSRMSSEILEHIVNQSKNLIADAAGVKISNVHIYIQL